MAFPNQAGPDAGPKRLTGLPLLGIALGVVLVVQALFVTSYIGALHHPKPHDVRFGVVGTSPLPAAVASQFSLSLRSYPSEADVRSALDHRKIDGAFVSGPAGSTLIVVPAAGNAGANALTGAFGAAAAAAHVKLQVVPVHPLPRERRRWERVVPRRHGADRRRLPVIDDRDRVRRYDAAPRATRRAGGRRGDRGADDRRRRRSWASARSRHRSSSCSGACSSS